jgi:8-amino-3,8-dideoxy-alpha-D-manno-octulosonate transaminase
MNNAPLLPYEWPGSYFYGEEELAEVTKVIQAKSPYRFFGHNLQNTAAQVEKYFCERLSREHALMVNSGSAALTIAFAAADIGPGDEVIVPGYMWVACLSAVVRLGAIPRLVEINDTFTIDPIDLEKKINERTKAVLLVHMSGTCGDITQITEICSRKNVLLIEDCAQCNGASYHGKPLGSFGDMAIFSFQYNKNITAGEGGMVVCNDTTLYKRAWAYHEQGYCQNDNGVVDWNGEVQTWGFCGHMSEVSAAILIAQTKKLDTITAKMRARNHQLYNGLGQIKGITTRRVNDPAGDSGPFVLISLPDAKTCREVVALTREAGVRSGEKGIGNICMDDWGLHIYYHNTSLVQKRGVNSKGRPWTDPLNEFAKDYHYGKGTLPYTDQLINRSILITVPPVLTEETCDKIIAIYADVVKKVLG